MTTDPIAAARALIADAIDFACAANHYLAGQEPEQAQQWRDALATLANALEVERTCAEKAESERGALVAAARLEGWRAGREAAADEAQSCTHDPYVVRAIRALPEPKEASHDCPPDH